MSDAPRDPVVASFLADFHRRHGRAPRVLHIGNIANNAYNNALLLNETGFDCDVICYDYYHIMGCPEWEDADFDESPADQFRPNWMSVAAGARVFERPRWFAQGRLQACLAYLVARREGRTKKADELWRELGHWNGTAPQPPVGVALRMIRMLFQGGRSLHEIAQIGETLGARAGSSFVGLLVAQALLIVAITSRLFLGLWNVVKHKVFRSTLEGETLDEAAARLAARFREAFPDRPDSMTRSDIEAYRFSYSGWRRLFEHYDLVQAYATDPFIPLLAGKRPYVGFEHGTLRDFTLGDDPVCRNTALGYRLADHVFITNGDCMPIARRLGITAMTPMPHPVNERRIASVPATPRKWHQELGASHVFLCTLRHDWAVKGTDRYIRAMPQLAAALGRDVRVIMTRWGAEQERSARLADELEVADLIVWRDPLPRRRLIEALKSVDVLFDQMALPHFGATAPEGIAAGIPVIMSYDPAATEWLFPEPAPILAAQSTDDIVRQVEVALDPDWRADYRRRAAAWFDTYHSSRVVVQRHVDVYRKCLLHENGDAAGASSSIGGYP